MSLFFNANGFVLFSFLIYGISQNIGNVDAGSAHLPGMGGRIYGGKKAVANQFPYLVHVYGQTPAYNSNGAGSIISRCFVLTAAHVTNKSKKVTITYGTLDRRNIFEPNFTKNAIDVYEYPNSDDKLPYLHDVALVKVEPFEFSPSVQAIKLEKNLKRSYTGVSAVVPGWGETEDPEDCSGSDFTLFTNLIIMDNSNVDYYEKEYIQSPGILFTSTTQNTSICNGDSGGPLVVKRYYGSIQVGTACFFSILGCDTGHPAGFARTAFYYSWIKEIVDKCDRTCKLKD